MISNMIRPLRAKGIISKLVLFSYLGLAVLILIKCEKEKAQPRVYPRVHTLPVNGITKDGATFFGEIYSLGTENITEHGFVWGTGSDPKYNYDNKVLLGETDKTGGFEAEILTTLAIGSNYHVRAFVKTDEHIVYGQNLLL